MTEIDVLTIGHSTHTLPVFMDMIRSAGITAIADVRSSPWSRFNPQFNKSDLRESLRLADIEYRFFGKQLGGRPTDRALFCGSTADYVAMARTVEFSEGLKLVLSGATKHRLALMCSEHDPLDCHRCLLVGRALAERGASVKHVLSDGSQSTQRQIEDKLLVMSGRDADDLFVPRADRLDAAYRERSMKVAFTERSAEEFGEREMQDLRYG